MYLTKNWKDEIAVIAGQIKNGESREGWLLRAARQAQISQWHAGALFYEKMIDPKWSIGIKVANAADKIRAAQREAAALTSQYQQIVRGSINVDQNILGAIAFEMFDAARLLGGADLPSDHRLSIVKK